MASLNRFQFIGNLGADPELSYIPSGTAKATIRLATAAVWTNSDGEKRESVQWHRVTFWGRLAEIAGEYLTKGRQVFVEGRIEHRSWEVNGQRRYATDFVATSLQMLGNGNGKAKAEPEEIEEPEAPEVGEDSPFDE